jgi:(2R)-ethylmalonyl-CoA mutase
VVEARVGELVAAAQEEIDRVQAMGGAVAAVESGYLKSALVEAHAHHRARIESGEQVVVGVNRFTTTEPSPLTAELGTSVQAVDPAAEETAAKAVAAWRNSRDSDPARAAEAAGALVQLTADAATDRNLMPATLRCARAGITTGEWAGALRGAFGEYRAPTGVGGVSGAPLAADGAAATELARVRASVRDTGAELGGRLRLLVGKPGLDGHSNGAEQVAVRARDVGFEVIYQGIRLTPEQIVAAAVAEDVHCVGLSVLSGSHLSLVPDVLERMRAAGLDDVPLIVGGIIPAADSRSLLAQGVAAVFTPKDISLTAMMGRMVEEIRRARGLESEPSST